MLIDCCPESHLTKIVQLHIHFFHFVCDNTFWAGCSCNRFASPQIYLHDAADMHVTLVTMFQQSLPINAHSDDPPVASVYVIVLETVIGLLGFPLLRVTVTVALSAPRLINSFTLSARPSNCRHR